MSGESLSDETMNNLVVIIKQLHMDVDKLCNEKMLSLLYPPPEKIPGRTPKIFLDTLC